MNEEKKLGYQKAWHIQVSGLKLIDFTRDRRGIITLDKANELRLFDQNGNELWHRPAGYDLVSLSLADTLEVLAVDAEKHSILYGPEGTTMWRKRPFPAVIGRISASGEYFSFVTSDPAIVGTDRSLRVKWAYRNLMKRPADIAVSGAGQVSSFPCADDRGDGVAAVNQAGKPFDPFMGMKTVSSVDVSEDGQAVLALDSGGGLYCVNPVRGYGIWKGKTSPRSTGVSYASQTGDSIVYSEQGRIIKFDDKGNQIWEHNFPERLLKAFICPDSQAIYYATERGEIGCLRRNTGDVVNNMEFMEKEVAEKGAENRFFFRKIWNIELEGSRENPPMVQSWLGHEGVEYALVWNGKDTLICLNDVGEEIWQQRLGETRLHAISASADADMVVAVTAFGVIGYDIDGNENFKFFGAFSDVYVFPESSMLLVDEKGQGRFYLSPEHFSHVLDSEEKILRLVPYNDDVIVVREKSLGIVDSDGNLVAETSLESCPFKVEVAQDKEKIVVGTESGQLHILSKELKIDFSYRLEGQVALASLASDTDDVFAAVKDKPEIFVLRRRSNELLKNSLTGDPIFSVSHQMGMVVGTNLDQLGLIGYDGVLIGRYTCPDRVVKLVECRRPNCFVLLTDDSLSCIVVVKDTRGPDRKPDN
ncbi:MAG: hypothetical protein PWR01_4771 [Clostridiales bacterium]|nr:hypothetical protein [Clostridiales bacterium]MDN5283698.1 hypothetical protein [Candidatus Ozemobacter sp.]